MYRYPDSRYIARHKDDIPVYPDLEPVRVYRLNPDGSKGRFLRTEDWRGKVTYQTRVEVDYRHPDTKRGILNREEVAADELVESLKA